MKEFNNDPLFEAWRNAMRMDSQVRGLLDKAITEGGTVEAPKAVNSQAAVWLLGRGCIITEGYDDNNFYYYIPEEAPAELVNECHAYWADQVARLDIVRAELRRLRLQAIANGLDEGCVTVPGAASDADSWELYLRELRRHIERLESARPSSVSATPSSPPSPSNKGGGCAVLSLVAMLVFAIFLTYVLFIR